MNPAGKGKRAQGVVVLTREAAIRSLAVFGRSVSASAPDRAVANQLRSALLIDLNDRRRVHILPDALDDAPPTITLH